MESLVYFGRRPGWRLDLETPRQQTPGDGLKTPANKEKYAKREQSRLPGVRRLNLES